jgi:hypothetical protein
VIAVRDEKSAGTDCTERADVADGDVEPLKEMDRPSAVGHLFNGGLREIVDAGARRVRLGLVDTEQP